MTRIKMCGLRRPEDIAAVNEVRPDFAGFILSPRFSRAVTLETQQELSRQLSPGILRVGVFVDETVDFIAGCTGAGTLDVIQLHGHEDQQYLAALRERLRRLSGGLAEKIQIFQAFQVKSEADVRAAERSSADRILLDAGTGNGVRFDWDIAGMCRRPFLLAGGLNPENVGEAIARLRPWGVDVSSGIETDRVKDPAKIRAFAEAVRRADAVR